MPDICVSLPDLSSTRRIDPRIAVVVPVFRHSVLLSEAIESVLDQRADFPIRIVLVNDGCPNRETDQVCRDYAMAYPNRITYLRKSNGGLSDARNNGIRHALTIWPSVKAIYMLDADNRLRPDALGNAMAALEADPNVGWIYPNIDMFGLRWAGDYGGDYSVLIHTMMNICEAGSLIGRAVFDAGVYFDTSFKSGFEDWDFFLTAAEAGFRGKNIDNFGFLYRKRAESMLADSEREAEVIRSEMRKKHKELFAPRGLMHLEQIETPRYALYLADIKQVLLTSDPDFRNERRISIDEYDELWWRTQTNNSQHYSPPILVITHSGVLEQLCQAKLLHSTLWTMETRLAQKEFVAVEISPCDNNRIIWQEDDVQGSSELFAGVLMIRPLVMDRIIRSSSLAWVSGLSAQPCSLPALRLRLQLPNSLFNASTNHYTAAAHDFVALNARLRSSPYRETLSHQWDWRDSGIPWRKKTHEIVRTATHAGAAFPRVHRGNCDVGFLLPLVEFGGVERVALNAARAMKQAGWRPHLFVLNSKECQYTDEWRETFDSVTFLLDSGFSTWGSARSDYFGTDVPDWSRFGNQRNATAMLAWLDVVINCHGGAISGVMGQLKRLGVRTALSLHLVDHSPLGRLMGNAYLGLGFEHAYDLILPCSQQLADWCHGMGVPGEKIVPMLNAPGFTVHEGARRLSLQRRRKRPVEGRLRVIYLGRLDHQKGLDRLISIIELSSRSELPVEWRLIGKQVITQNAPPIPVRIARMMESPLLEPDALADAFEWADVLILPSYFEGLPLTILEAMRQGVVPIATDAGAVTEVIHHGLNGIVLSQRETVSEAFAELSRLAMDRAALARLSEKAQSDMQGRNWDTAVNPVMVRLAAMMGFDGSVAQIAGGMPLANPGC